MDFGLSEPQRLLQRSIRDFVARELPISRVREIMESASGSDRELHVQLGDQGIAGLLVGEDYGGVGLDLLDACVAAQELGRAAAPVSYHSACVLAPLLLQSSASEEQRAAWLPGIADGSRLVTVATQSISLDDGRLRGTSLFVPDAHVADAIIVPAEGTAGLCLTIVPTDRAGVAVTQLSTVDETRRVCEVVFDDVAVEPGDRISLDDPDSSFRRALDAARIVLSADALAGAQEALRIAVEYAKQREQFNRVIASFQAVKHMCAEVIAEVDPVQSLVWHTAWSWDQGSDDLDYLVPMLKSHATETATEATTKTTQVFGGIGFTHECDSHLYYKRAGYDRQMLGGPSEMRRQAAAAQF